MIKFKCPECKHEFEAEPDYGSDTEVYCELCGTHPAVVCPKCDELVDIVFNEL